MLSRTLYLSGWLCASVFSVPTWTVAEASTTDVAKPATLKTPSTAPLTLSEAIARALARHPELQADQLAVDIAQEGVSQARLRPNPELQIQSEDLSDSKQTVSANWVQTLELGGKRSRRIDLAESERQSAEIGLAGKRADFIARVRSAFMQALLTYRLAENQRQNSGLMKEWADSVQQRVDAGKISPLEGDRARLASLSARNAAQGAQREWTIAINRLATLLGQNDTPTIAPQVTDKSSLPPWTHVKSLLTGSPRAKLLAAEADRAKAEIGLQQSLAIQDIQLSAGVKNDRATGDNGVMVGVSISLPFSHRNQGAIRQAELRWQQTQLQQAAALRELELQALTLWDRMNGLQKTIVLMDEELIPGAEKAFSKAREGHQLGKFAFIDVLDAQRTLVDLRKEQFQTLQNYAEYESELEALLGTPLSALGMPVMGETQ